MNNSAGVVRSHQKQLAEMKRDCASRILAACRASVSSPKRTVSDTIIETAAGVIVPKMYYVNFADKITRVYHVVLRNWPLDHFCPPATLTSKAELQLLLNALKTCECHFVKLNREEILMLEDFLMTHEADDPLSPVPVVTFLNKRQTAAANIDSTAQGIACRIASELTKNINIVRRAIFSER
jgi:hypothetical protein